MMRQNHGYNCLSQPHAPQEDGGAADLCEACVNCCFVLYFFVKIKIKMSFGLNNINKQIMVKLQPNP
jgi:hypothetical protein